MLQTMAIRISEKNYPIAAACLPAGFLAIHPNKVFGCYLVINKVRVKNPEKTGMRREVMLENMWLEDEEFFENYQPIGNPTDTHFFEVSHH